MGTTAEEALGASMTYTNKKVSESAGLHREIVASLPATGDENTIYMVLDQTASSPDVYDEWLWTNGAYEHIGSTRVDLSDYYNKTQVDTALSGKANTATSLSGYGITDAYTKTEVDTALSGKASTSDIPTALSQLSADSTHRVVTDTEKTTWNTASSRVSANTFNSSEDITSHNSSSNPFICPKDGYVSLVLANGASGTVYAGGRELLTVSSSQGRTVSPVFVKAGMSVYLTDASGTKYLYYEPLKY